MRSLRSLPRRLVIAPETYRWLMDCPSQRCNRIVTPKLARLPLPLKAQREAGLMSYASDLLCCFPDRPPASRYALQAGLDPRAQLLRQRRIAELRRLRLAVGLGPPNELHERPCLRRVAVRLVDQEPSEARGGIGLGARGVGDGHAEVPIPAH